MNATVLQVLRKNVEVDERLANSIHLLEQQIQVQHEMIELQGRLIASLESRIVALENLDRPKS
jgi:hypothetical protein